MPDTMTAAPAPNAKDRATPRLETGDRLTAVEFERRYLAHPEIKKAELIEGVVFVASPVRFEEHGEPQADILGWLSIYRALHPDVRAGDNVTVRLDLDNTFQPDAILRRVDDGTSRLADGYVEGPPELVVEVAASTVSIDLHAKKNVYRRAGVAEYLVWRVEDGAIDWFALQNGEYALLEPDPSGVVSSLVFPGLRLHVPKLLARDLAGVFAQQQRATP